MTNSYINQIHNAIEEDHAMMLPGQNDGYNDIYRLNRKPYIEERCS